MYLTWEISIQGIGNHFDIVQFQSTLVHNKHFFETEFNEKKQFLTTYKAGNEGEFTEKMHRLKSLQNQYFESNTTKELVIKQHNTKIQLALIRHSNIIQAEIKLSKIFDTFCQKYTETANRIQTISINLNQQQQLLLQQNEDQQNNLTQRSIRRFQLFTADESHVSCQCSICMEEIYVGRRMRRLTCDGQHYFCQECIEGWFAEHNTCPLCRHVFN